MSPRTGRTPRRTASRRSRRRATNSTSAQALSERAPAAPSSGPFAFLGGLTLMRLRALAVAAALVAAPWATAEEPSTDVKVRWHGHACFSLEFPTGLKVL